MLLQLVNLEDGLFFMRAQDRRYYTVVGVVSLFLFNYITNLHGKIDK